MEFVVNEWLMEYLRPNATYSEKTLAQQFLQRFMQNENDIIFVREPSEFLNKVFRYAKEYQQNAEIILFYRRFIKEILLDQSKCRRITENIVLPETVVANLNQPNTNFNSDTYLFEAASLTNTKIIVTTDEKLINQMNTVDDFKIISLIDFLESY